MKNVKWSRKVVSFTNLWKKFVCRTARFSKSLAGGRGSVEIASTRIQDVFPRCGFMFFLRSFPKYGAGRSRLFVGSRSDVVARRFPRQGGRGFALALTLFLLVILSTVCFGALNITNLDSRGAMEEYYAAKSLYAARAGLAEAKAALTRSFYSSMYSDTLSGVKHTLNSVEGDTQEASYEISVTPAADNDTRAKRMWKVTSKGRCGDATRTLVAFLEKESFSKYIYFTDQEISSASNGVIWFGTGDRLEGYTHTNGYFSVEGHPEFTSQITSSNTGDSAYNSTTGNYKLGKYNSSTGQYSLTSTVTRDASKFYHSYTGDYNADGPAAADESADFSFSGGQPKIPLPTNWWASNGTPTDKNEIYRVASAGGRCYEGNSYKLVFSENGKATLYKQGNGGQSWVKDSVIDTSNFTGVTLYFKKDVYIEGKLKGRVTLAAGNNITISGDVTYKDPNNDVLGLLSGKDIIVASWSRSANSDRYIHAVMMALNGSFYVQDYNNSNIGAGGKLHVYGGIIQKSRGAVATFRSSAGQYSIVSGYNKDYIYDKKLRTSPPDNFPTTSKLNLLYVTDASSLGATH